MIWGNCAMGSPARDTAPSSTVSMAMTIATMGRRMKNAEITVCSLVTIGRGCRGCAGSGGGRRGPSRRGWHQLGDDRRTVADLLDAVDDHLVADVDPRR